MMLCKDFGKYPDCKGEIHISKRVLELMSERGESLPARCESCAKRHRTGKRETRQSYFQQTMNTVTGNIRKCHYLASGYTAHGERGKIEDTPKPDSSGMRIRITDEHIKELYKKLFENQVVVLASPTGTGKSVYVLYRLLEAPADYEGDFVKKLIRQGQVIQTQPLTFATASIPETVSRKLLGESGVEPLGMLGIRHRGREDYSRHNLGVVVTDGSLTNWIRDGHLGQYSLVMVDEAHKRSVNIDKLLTLLRYKLPLYPHLKVIIASATINLEEFKNSFERKGIATEVLDLSLTLQDEINYNVHYWKGQAVEGCDCWMCKSEELRENFWRKKSLPPEEAELPEVVSSFVVEILRNTDKGGILVFLTGESVIEQTNEVLGAKLKRIPSLKKVPILPIYSRLGEKEVEKRFSHEADKKVLLTTDIAETSHTLKDIIYVIESGYIKQYQWDPQDLSSTLPTIRHSQAGCRQRFGRVGRTQKGYVYCLYTKEEFDGQFKMQTTPEIFRSPVDDTYLTAKAAGISDELEFIGRPDDRIKFNSEVKRALSTIRNEGYTDVTGNITDDGIDTFRVPLSPEKKALLDLADEQGCLIEMSTYLSMIGTEKGEARTGAEIFNPAHGLLVWDPRWCASTKMNVWRVQNALKTGCIDDIDFILQLAICYLDARQRGVERQWAEHNFLNYEVFQNIFDSQKEFLEVYLAKAEERQLRELSVDYNSKLRLILGIILKGRTIMISQQENRLAYKFQGEEVVCGLIHDACVGEWKDGDTALLITATKKKNVLDGQEKIVSHACSLVRLDTTKSSLRKDHMFHNVISVDSRVSITEDKQGSYIEALVQAPPQINVEYGEKLDFSMVMDDFLKKDFKPAITFDNSEAKRLFAEIGHRIGVIWQDETRVGNGNVYAWKVIEGVPYALITSSDEKEALKSIAAKDKVSVQIIKVFKGPGDFKGWILTMVEGGILLPIESGDLSLSHMNYGLQYLEGKQISLYVKRVNRRGFVVLSNINNIISRLNDLRQQINQSGYETFQAIIDKVDLTKNTISVFVINEDCSIFTFTIREKSIPRTLRVGNEIEIDVVKNNKGEGFMYCCLEDYQIDSIPKVEGWEYDNENEKLWFPYFLNEKDMDCLEVEDELKETIFKNSWNYGFIAKRK